MTGQQLRNSILQEAIYGRLVPNMLQPGEKTGGDLLKDILAERQKKENEEKGKKAKKLTLSTIEEEPWELPEGWCWCRISDLCELSDATKKSGDYVNMDAAFLRGKTSGTIIKSGKFVRTGARMILVDGENSGEVFIAPCDGYLGSTFKELSVFLNDCAPYLLLFLSFNKELFRNNKKGAAIPHLNKEIFKNLGIPLPPLSIQKAIVDKIEELLPLIDEYDNAAVELETLNKILPDKLRKSVLQEAIHGTLVPNDIPEGEATGAELLQQILKERQDKENKEKGKKAKKLTLSTIEEEPWELPEEWCWGTLSDCVDELGDGIHGTPQYYPAGDYFFINGNNLNNGTIEIKPDTKRVDENEYLKHKKPLNSTTVLVSINGTIGNVAFYNDEPVILGKSACYFNLRPVLTKRYVQLIINSDYFLKYAKKEATGTTIKNLSLKAMRMLPIPIPPLSIQHRIVEKIEEVFSAINKLQA